MKFSFATLVSFAALTLGATVTGDADVLAGLMKAVSDIPVAVAQNALDVLFQATLDYGEHYGASTKGAVKPTLEEVLQHFSLQNNIWDLISYDVTRAENSGLDDWRFSIDLDMSDDLRDLVGDSANALGYSLDDPEFYYWVTEDIVKSYLALIVARDAEAANPKVKIVEDYNPRTPTLKDLDSIDLTKLINKSVDSYLAQMAAATKTNEAALNELAQQKQQEQEQAGKAAAALADKIAAQKTDLENLQNQLQALKQKTVEPEAPKQSTEITETLDQINSQAGELAQKQKETAQEAAEVANTIDSDILKALAVDIAAQAEAIKMLSQKTVEETVKAPDSIETIETPETKAPIVDAAAEVETPANATEEAEATVADNETPVADIDTPVADIETSVADTESPAESPIAPIAPAAPIAAAPASNAMANSTSNSSSSSSSSSNSNSNSESNANANVNIFLVGGNRAGKPGNSVSGNGVQGISNSTIPSEDTYVTVYETDCPVTTTDTAGSTIVTHTKSTVTSTVCPKCTKTADSKSDSKPTPAVELDDIVTVYVTDCPVTSIDSEGSTHIGKSQSTVTSTVCTKCTKKNDTPIETPKFSNGTHASLTQSVKTQSQPTLPAKQPQTVIPQQANGASKAAFGAAAVLPMIVALL